MPKVITVSSEKGGVGKSTFSAHVAVYLHSKNKKTCVIDCDYEQGTLTRYFQNRKNNNLSTPDCIASPASKLSAKIKNASQSYDIVIIDTPAGRSDSADIAHNASDTVLSIFNDSYLDLDVLARIEKDNLSPQNYSARIWEERKLRIEQGLQPQNWIIFLNRVGHLSNNRRHVLDIVKKIAKKYGGIYGGFIKERVGYREGFLQGLTILDRGNATSSSVAARQEIRDLASQLL